MLDLKECVRSPCSNAIDIMLMSFTYGIVLMRSDYIFTFYIIPPHWGSTNGPFYWHGLTLITAWISNYIHSYKLSLGMDEWFHPTVYWACDYLSMLELKLYHVSKRGPSSWSPSLWRQWPTCYWDSKMAAVGQLTEGARVSAVCNQPALVGIIQAWDGGAQHKPLPNGLGQANLPVRPVIFLKVVF